MSETVSFCLLTADRGRVRVRVCVCVSLTRIEVTKLSN